VGVLRFLGHKYKDLFFNPVVGVFYLFYPLVIVGILGFIIGNTPNFLFKGMGFVDFTTPGVLSIVLALNGLVLLPMDSSCMYAVLPSSKNVSYRTRIIGLWIFHLSLSAASILVMYVFGRLFYGIRAPRDLPLTIAACLLSAAVFEQMGFILTGWLKKPQTMLVLGFCLFLLFAVFGLVVSTFGDISVLKPFLHDNAKAFAGWLPIHYSIQLLSSSWQGLKLNHLTQAWLVLAGLTAGLFAVDFFLRPLRNGYSKKTQP